MIRVKHTAPSAGAAIVYIVVWLVLMAWSVYFLVKSAAHVGAWPFG